ncbi:PREDICTED: uncharacterized protein LOC106809426 [Priapulus caudatus]|uniref:Uncharacterized protein LOC106809426 n=1 Tax=Priapulus caudatus TaxID=37621 RepID=A0ABM1E722_PRICU|nr:PREDICTED: uncharacterized protein LOC106809426 [Priapulus caudatus]
MKWEDLPDIVLEQIYQMLDITHRYNASMVCRHWHEAFYAPRIWETFIFKENMLQRKKFMPYGSWQYQFNPYLAQTVLRKVAHHWKRLVIEPMTSFYNLHEFLTVVSAYIDLCLQNGEEFPLPRLKCFKFRFACQQHLGGNRGKFVIGTGGKILRTLQELMQRLRGLQELQLTHLLLEMHEALQLLDDTLANSGDTLRTLRVIDCAKVPHPFLHVGLFFNLRKLIISPNHVDEDVVHLLGFTRVRLVVLYQDAYTCRCRAAPGHAWRDMRARAPAVRIELVLTGATRSDMLLQEGAPVRSILYDTKYSVMKLNTLMFIVDNYASTLEVFAHQQIPRVHRPKSFQDRPDSNLLSLVRTCVRLHTLVIRERVSTCTLLIIAVFAERLQHFFVRRNAVILRCDWPSGPMLTECYAWLKETSRSYELVEQEVSKKLNKPWKLLSDPEFKQLSLITI